MAFKRGVEEIILNTYVALGNIHQPPTDPTLPEANSLRFYAKPKGGIAWLYWEDELGNIHELAGSGGGGGSGCCEILVADGICAPPIMLTTEDECDFLYEDPA